MIKRRTCSEQCRVKAGIYVRPAMTSRALHFQLLGYDRDLTPAWQLRLVENVRRRLQSYVGIDFMLARCIGVIDHRTLYQPVPDALPGQQALHRLATVCSG
jgi:hypothetical protein